MSPYTVTISGQTITSLRFGETCPLSEDDMFKDYELSDEIVDVGNSKIYVPIYSYDLIQGGIRASKSYFEQDFLNKVDKYLSEDSIILDIGANIGNHTLYWANERHAKKIYAFEPIAFTFNILKKNIEINNLQDRVVLNNVGLSDENGEGEITCFCKQNIGGTRLKKLESNTPLVIKLATLDSFDINEDKIDLIKIDVECMEREVLRGAEKTIKKYKPVILVESFPDIFKDTNKILEDYGYEKISDMGSYEYLYLYKG